MVCASNLTGTGRRPRVTRLLSFALGPEASHPIARRRQACIGDYSSDTRTAALWLSTDGSYFCIALAVVRNAKWPDVVAHLAGE